jgi:hypothetical protein
VKATCRSEIDSRGRLNEACLQESVGVLRDVKSRSIAPNVLASSDELPAKIGNPAEMPMPHDAVLAIGAAGFLDFAALAEIAEWSHWNKSGS